DETASPLKSSGRELLCVRAGLGVLRICDRLASQSIEHGSDDTIATRALEPESGFHCDVDIARKRLAAKAAGTEEAGTHRRSGNVEALRGFLDGQLLQRAQDEYGSERGRQSIDMTFEQPARLLAHGRAIGLLSCSRQCLAAQNATIHFEHVVQRHIVVLLLR